ncbi:MAG TPA: hypothetical protein VIP46_03970 [Pyrinomonadaceae bacterium]
MELLLAVIVALAQGGAAGNAATVPDAGGTSAERTCETAGAGEVEGECAGAAANMQFMALQQDVKL